MHFERQNTFQNACRRENPDIKIIKKNMCAYTLPKIFDQMFKDQNSNDCLSTKFGQNVHIIFNGMSH